VRLDINGLNSLHKSAAVAARRNALMKATMPPLALLLLSLILLLPLLALTLLPLLKLLLLLTSYYALRQVHWLPAAWHWPAVP
jgi:hypothetical protein